MALESVASPLAVSKPILSLIVPTHLRPQLLSRALASVNAQAGRDQIEVIVVSDVIDSATDEVCANCSARVTSTCAETGHPALRPVETWV
jgi:cellulose synthase/poly-beta-1,6-N-acetylglucosamine synthase-like glycosyltransferase